MCITLFRYFLLFLLSAFLTYSDVFGQNMNQVQTGIEYYNKGEVEKARSTFESLAKNRQNIPFIHNSYLEILLMDKDGSNAHKYIKQIQKWSPENIFYKIDEGLIYAHFNDHKKANDIYADVAKFASTNPMLVRTTVRCTLRSSVTGEAADVDEAGVDLAAHPRDFPVYLDNVYRRVNTEGKLEDELLNFVHHKPDNLSNVHNMSLSLCTAVGDL